jgi:AmpD protein
MPLLISDDGWLNVARRCPSPNYNLRPQTPISLVVVHNISLPPNNLVAPILSNCLLIP